MKKAAIFILSLCLILALGACGNDGLYKAPLRKLPRRRHCPETDRSRQLRGRERILRSVTKRRRRKWNPPMRYRMWIPM